MGKKYRERIEREKAVSWTVRMRKSLVWKIFRFCAKTLAVLAFGLYVMLGSTMTYGWIATKWARHYPPGHIEVVARDYLLRKEPEPERVREWFQMREMKDCRILMDKLTPFTPHLASTTFFLFSSCAAQEGKLEEALNWRQYARFRARFDALRCGSNDAPENYNDMIDITKRDDMMQLMERNPSLQPKSINWVLEYDAKFPSPDNNPLEICKQLTAFEKGSFTLVDRKEWEPIHDTLRRLSEYFASLMEADIKRGGRGVIDMPRLSVPRGQIQDEMDKAFKEQRDQKEKDAQDEKKKKEE